jgi:uncharacterized protein (DUF58 family)
MIPRAPLLWLLATLAFASLIIAVVPAVAVYWLGAVAIAAILLLMDAALAFTVTLPQLERIAPGSMSLGNWSRVSISVRNSTKRTLHVSLYDHHPATFASRKLPLEVCLPAGKFATADYEVCPGQRGAFEFPGCDLRIASPLKCWARQCVFTPIIPAYRNCLLSKSRITCRLPVCASAGGAVKVSNFTSYATTGTVTACAPSTGKRPRAWAV